jgi:hypothetical protein
MRLTLLWLVAAAVAVARVIGRTGRVVVAPAAQ